MTNTATKARSSRSSKPRRMAREPQGGKDATQPKPPKQSKPDKQPSKLDRVEALLLAPDGASIAELMASSGWQQHSVRGAMAGALKKRGLAITSEKIDGTRRYRASRPA